MTWKVKNKWKGWTVYCIGKDLDTLSQEEILALDKETREEIYTEQ